MVPIPPALVLAALSYQSMILLAEGTRLLFAFAFGACVGSLINVLVYRLPRGLSVVLPASRCPSCSTKLRWNDNIPVFGWVFLRGRCRYCRNPISPEYPIVEGIVGLLFVVVYGLWFALPQFQALGMQTHWLGVDWLELRPAWTENWGSLVHGWPVLMIVIVLVGSLMAMLLVDAKTCTIPLVLTWTPALVALVLHPLTAWWYERGLDSGIAWAVRWRWAEGWSYAIASPGPNGWKWVGIAIGGVVGLGVGLVLVRLGLLKQSFGSEYEAWEAEHLAAAGEGSKEDDSRSASVAEHADPDSGEPEDAVSTTPPPSDPLDPVDSGESEPDAGQVDRKDSPLLAREPMGLPRLGLIAGVVIACGILGGLIASSAGWLAIVGVTAGLLVGPFVAAVPVRLLGLEASAGGDDDEDATEVWLEYPHARREVLREVLFLGPCLLLGMLGGVLAQRWAGPWVVDPATFDATARVAVPMWLDALSGVLMGYLIGGGVVWAVRILGSLLFGKEAMGLGDVHMMAGVGACLGWIDPVLAFFLGAFVALYREAVSRVLAGAGRRAMPFGPALAVATVVVLMGKPWITEAVNAWLHRPADQQIVLP